MHALTPGRPRLPNDMQGWSHARVVLITPLFFSAAHLHHLRELLVVQRMAPQRALAMVRGACVEGGVDLRSVTTSQRRC